MPVVTVLPQERKHRQKCKLLIKNRKPGLWSSQAGFSVRWYFGKLLLALLQSDNEEYECRNRDGGPSDVSARNFPIRGFCLRGIANLK